MSSGQSGTPGKRTPFRTSEVKFLTPPTGWKEKITEGAGRDLETIQQQARAAMQRMHEDYLVRARDSLAAIDAALAAARSTRGVQRDEAVQSIRMASHEMRNEAATLGYDMLTRIGTSLCDRIERATEFGEVPLETIATHADAMRRVIWAEDSGRGDKAGKPVPAGAETPPKGTSKA